MPDKMMKGSGYKQQMYNQHANSQKGGAQLCDVAPSAPRRAVPAFQGMSGKGDNQETYRKYGK